QRFPFYDQRMIARRCERLGELAENILSVVMNLAGLPVEQFRGANNLPAKRGANRLMPQANAENGKFPGEPLDKLHRNASLLRRARSRRNHDLLWLPARNLFD